MNPFSSFSSFLFLFSVIQTGATKNPALSTPKAPTLTFILKSVSHALACRSEQ